MTTQYEQGAPFRCSNCHEHLEDHTPEKQCLFAPTVFSSMDPAEYEAWFMALPENSWRKVGVDFIRDALNETGFARQILQAMPADEEKP